MQDYTVHIYNFYGGLEKTVTISVNIEERVKYEYEKLYGELPEGWEISATKILKEKNWR